MKQAHQGRYDTMQEFLWSASDPELHDLITYLIAHRERLKEDVLRALEQRTAALLEELEHIKRQELAAELRCFRDTLALQRRLLP